MGGGVIRKGKPFIMLTVDFLLIILFGIVIGLFSGSLNLAPKGWDYFSHATKVKWVLKEPFTLWNPEWYAGFFPFRYCGVLPYWVLALFSRPFGVEEAFVYTSILSIILTALFLYCTVYEASTVRLASLLTSFYYLSCSSVWAYYVREGLYPRLFATPFFTLCLWLAVRFSRKLNEDNKNNVKKTYILLIVALILTILYHMAIGLIAVLTVLFYLLVCVGGFKRKIKSMFKVFIPLTGLTAFQHIPFFFPQRKDAVSLIMNYPPLNFSIFMGIDNIGTSSSTSPALAPMLLPLSIMGFGVIVYLRLKKKYKVNNLSFKSLTVFVCLSFTVIYYGVQGVTSYLPRIIPYAYGFSPFNTSPYISAIYLSLTLGLVLSVIKQMKVQRNLLYKAFCIATIIILVYWIPYLPAKIEAHMIHKPIGYRVIEDDREVLSKVVEAANMNYRIALTIHHSPAFNYVFDGFQVSGYYYQGTLYPDRDYWLFKELSSPVGELNILAFLLDWYGVKYLIVSAANKKLCEKYYNSEYFIAPFRVPNKGFYPIEYVNATPIAVSTDAPTILFVTDNYGYRIFMKILSLFNLNSSNIIPIYKGRIVDNFNLEELSMFKVVVLYNWQFKDFEKMENILCRYVEQGGRLLILSDPMEITLNRDPALHTPAFYPLSRIKIGEVSKDWDVEGNFPVSADFSAFSPRVWGEGAWCASFSFNNAIRTWVSAVLLDHGHPIAAYGKLGDGYVVWVGINLPYHIAYYNNAEEARFLVKILSFLHNLCGTTINLKLKRPDYSTIILTIKKPAKGLVVKENYYRSWEAEVLDNQKMKRSLRVYDAGPHMMYIYLPQNLAYPVKVVLKLKPDMPYFIGGGISLITLVVFTVAVARRKNI